VKTVNGQPQVAHGTARRKQLDTSCHCSGRCSEVSLISPEAARVVDAFEDVCRCQVLEVDIQQQKDGPFQRIVICPHRDGIPEDFCFSLLCLVVMGGCNNQHVPPSFSKVALHAKSGKSNSKVSSLWSSLFDNMRDKFETLNTRINGKLSSHCDRGWSNQVVVETPGLFLTAVFHTGWANRGRDTLWECVSDSFVLSKQAGASRSSHLQTIQCAHPFAHPCAQLKESAKPICSPDR